MKDYKAEIEEEFKKYCTGKICQECDMWNGLCDFYKWELIEARLDRK